MASGDCDRNSSAICLVCTSRRSLCVNALDCTLGVGQPNLIDVRAGDRRIGLGRVDVKNLRGITNCRRNQASAEALPGCHSQQRRRRRWTINH